MNTKLQFLIFLWLTTWYSHAQDIPYKNFHTENGLPSNETYHLHEDNKGFVWICTDKGVVRYDGQNFQQFSTLDGLVSNTVFNAISDQQGRTWFLSLKNELCYYQNNSIHQHPLNDSIRQLLPSGSFIPSLVIDSTGGIWFSRDSRALAYQNTNYYHIPSSNDTLQVKSIDIPVYRDSILGTQSIVRIQKQGLLLLGTQHYVGVPYPPLPTPKSGPHKRYKNLFFLGNAGLYSMTELNDGNFICFNHRQLYLIDQHNNQVLEQTTIPEEAGTIIKIYQDSYNNLWISTQAGVLYYANGSLNQVPKHFFKEFSITSVLISQDGTVWCSTFKNGILMIPDMQARIFQKAANSVSKFNSFSALVSTKKNNYAVSRAGHIFSLVDSPQLLLSCGPDFVLSAISYGHDKLLLSNGIGINFPQKDTFNVNYLKRQHYNIKTLFFHPQTHQLWVGVPSGLSRVSQSIFYSAFPYRTYTVNAIPNSNYLLVGSQEGLYRYNTQTDSFESYQQLHPALKERIHQIKKTPSNNFFIGTVGSGLLLLRKDTCLDFTPKDGLISPFIRSIFVENDSIVWVGTIKGANRIVFNSNYQIKSIQTYSKADILPASSVNDILVTPTYVWMATENGLVRFYNPNNNPFSKQLSSNVHVLTAHANDEKISAQTNLKYYQNYLEFSFVNIKFKSKNTTYAYRLMGLDSTWRFTKEPKISYASLPPGNYTFCIGVRLPNHQISIHQDSFKFSITPHFTQTWWFYALILLGSSLIIGGVIWFKFERNKLEKQKAQAEQRALYGQIKPHFIFNAMNSILYFIEENNSKAASLYLRSFSKLLRRVLENSQKDLIPIPLEFAAIQEYLNVEAMRMNDSTMGRYEHHFSISKVPSTCTFYKIPPMLIQPLVENAILHGLSTKKSNRLLSISLKEQADSIQITIQDNGIGRAASARINKRRMHHESTGLQNIQSRLRTLSLLYKKNFQLEIVDLEEGTASILTLPKLIPQTPNKDEASYS